MTACRSRQTTQAMTKAVTGRVRTAWILDIPVNIKATNPSSDEDSPHVYMLSHVTSHGLDPRSSILQLLLERQERGEEQLGVASFCPNLSRIISKFKFNIQVAASGPPATESFKPSSFAKP